MGAVFEHMILMIQFLVRDYLSLAKKVNECDNEKCSLFGRNHSKIWYNHVRTFMQNINIDTK